MDWFIGAGFLPNKTFPMIFHNVEGECIKSGHSFTNIKEAVVVMKYVHKILDETCESRKILQTEIGIFNSLLYNLFNQFCINLLILCLY